MPGFYMLQPNQAAAITLFGSYKGTDRTTGLRWIVPWYGKKKVSARANNIISDKIKVNDLRGNPIEIAAQVVWRVTDTAQALFDVDDYKAFVMVQIEAAVRTIGSRYPYDDFEHQEVTLRGNHDQVGVELRQELIARLTMAGITVDECGFTHLAYAQEIAGAMLRRQQAQAVVAARQTLVEGAVGMVADGARAIVGEERGRARRRAPRGDGVEPDGRAVRRARHAADRQCGLALPVSADVAAPPKKAFPLRLDPGLYAAIERAAASDLRSVNAQVECLLARGAGQARREAGGAGARQARPAAEAED